MIKSQNKIRVGECRLCQTITIDRLILSPISLRMLLFILQIGFRSGYRHTAAAWSKQIQTELEDIKKFENMLHDKIQELEIELEDSSTAREKEILVNQTDTLNCVLDHLFNLKPGGDEIRTIKMAKTNNNYQKANRRK
jgi:transcriptional regulator of heat shock response